MSAISLSKKTAAGQGDIPYQFMEQLSLSCLRSLFRLYNSCIFMCWKMAFLPTVVSVLKQEYRLNAFLIRDFFHLRCFFVSLGTQQTYFKDFDNDFSFIIYSFYYLVPHPLGRQLIAGETKRFHDSNFLEICSKEASV